MIRGMDKKQVSATCPNCGKSIEIKKEGISVSWVSGRASLHFGKCPECGAWNQAILPSDDGSDSYLHHAMRCAVSEAVREGRVLIAEGAGDQTPLSSFEEVTRMKYKERGTPLPMFDELSGKQKKIVPHIEVKKEV